MKDSFRAGHNVVRLEAPFTNRAGVFFNKDAKILELEQANRKLKEELDQQMNFFQKKSVQFKAHKTDISSIETQNNLIEIQIMMCQQEIQKLRKQYEILVPDLDLKQSSVASDQIQVQQLRSSLEQLLARDQEQKSLIQRYRQQIKIEKTMSKSQKNLNSICESLRKSNDNYQKNIDILKSKLESKRKYLAILDKKLQKKRKTEQKVNKQHGSGKKELRSHLSTPIIQNKRGNVSNNEEEKDKRDCRVEMKGYNDLVRKKNAILSKKK